MGQCCEKRMKDEEEKLRQNFYNLNKSLFQQIYQVIPWKNKQRRDREISSPNQSGKIIYVKQVEHRQNKDLRVAKFFCLNKIPDVNEQIRNHIQTLIKIEISNILTIHEYFIENNNLIVIYEDCPGDSLFKFLNRYKLQDMKPINLIINQIIYAVCTIHQHGLLHLNLNPDNILLQDTAIFHLKISHFQIVQFLLKSGNHQIHNWKYSAPEVLQGKQATQKADSWSIGIIILEIILNRYPFQTSQNEDEIKNTIINFNFEAEFASKAQSNRINPNSFELLSKLLQIDPEKRISVQEAQQITQILLSDQQIQKGMQNVFVGLTQYMNLNEFQQMFYDYIINYCIQCNEKTQAITLFQSLDKNGTGEITHDEGVEIICKISNGQTKEQIEGSVLSFMQKMDKNNDKKISQKGNFQLQSSYHLLFLLRQRLLMNYQDKPLNTLIQQKFNYQNKSGTVDIHDFEVVIDDEQLLKSLKEIIKKNDQDENKSLDFDEFVKLCRS